MGIPVKVNGFSRLELGAIDYPNVDRLNNDTVCIRNLLPVISEAGVAPHSIGRAYQLELYRIEPAVVEELNQT